MKLVQINCLEGKTIDSRQAEAVLRHRPNFIIFEAPTSLRSPNTPFNSYQPENKPLHLVKDHINMLKQVGKKYPWVLSDIRVYENIVKLWKEGHNVQLYNVDGPSDLLQVPDKQTDRFSPYPPRRGTYLFFWVRVYLREKIMTNHLRPILAEHSDSDATGLIFLQKFHWINVQFQSSRPTKAALWKYYFGSFAQLTPKELTAKIKNHNSTLYKYWTKFSDFS